MDGKWTNGDGTETFTSENPATGEELARFHRGTDADVDAALEAIETVTERTAWTLNNSTEIEMAQRLSADIEQR